MAGLALAALLVGCGPTGYRPATSAGGAGHRTTQIAQDRYLVSFEGNAATPRQTVEAFMLYRAAEVASRTGHPYFAIVASDVERKVDVDVFPSSPFPYGHGGYGRRGSRIGVGIGVGYGFPRGGVGLGRRFPPVPGYGLGPTVMTTDSYEAFATVETLDARPPGRSDVFETQDVLATLGPRVAASRR